MPSRKHTTQLVFSFTEAEIWRCLGVQGSTRFEPGAGRAVNTGHPHVRGEHSNYTKISRTIAPKKRGFREGWG